MNRNIGIIDNVALQPAIEAGIMPWDSDFDVKLYTEADITMEGATCFHFGLLISATISAKEGMAV